MLFVNVINVLEFFIKNMFILDTTSFCKIFEFCRVLPCLDQCRDKESIVNTEDRLRDFTNVATLKKYL
jgi:hypothetical protein